MSKSYKIVLTILGVLYLIGLAQYVYEKKKRDVGMTHLLDSNEHAFKDSSIPRGSHMVLVDSTFECPISYYNIHMRSLMIQAFKDSKWEYVEWLKGDSGVFFVKGHTHYDEPMTPYKLGQWLHQNIPDNRKIISHKKHKFKLHMSDSGYFSHEYWGDYYDTYKLKDWHSLSESIYQYKIPTLEDDKSWTKWVNTEDTIRVDTIHNIEWLVYIFHSLRHGNIPILETSMLGDSILLVHTNNIWLLSERDYDPIFHKFLNTQRTDTIDLIVYKLKDSPKPHYNLPYGSVNQ